MATLARPIVITNTQSRKKEVFAPMTPGRIKMYSCGPTVYGFIHIGNLRAAMTADLFFRFFKRFGFEVEYVRNYTDIDDKIIKLALAEGIPFEQLTSRFIGEVEKDYALAGLQEPTHKTKVTDHLPEIVSMIEEIIAHGKAYATPDGEVFFSIASFPRYGELSGRPLEDLRAGARVEVNPHKKDPMDFTLWKPAKPGEPAWDSPWGTGRPGWHIECSAMACKWLGPQMDLHHGGEDLIFPHHENEIAQSEAATNAEPYSKFWVHNAFLNLSGEKMSKSLGNVWNARDFLATYGSELTRMIFLGVHYRTAFDINADTIEQGIAALQRIYEAKKTAEEVCQKQLRVPDLMAEQGWGGFLIDCERARDGILNSLANDLNTPLVFSYLFNLIREWNRCAAFPNALNTPSAILAAREFIRVIEEECGAVLGIGLKRAESSLDALNQVKKLRHEDQGQPGLSEEEIGELLEERKNARLQKNFKRSDEIRDLLATNLVEIKDSPQGTTWTRK